MKGIMEDTYAHWKNHHAPRMGAALSYYAMLSFIPLLVLLINAGSLLFKKELVEHVVIQELNGIVGGGTARYIGDILNAAQTQIIGIKTAVITGATLILGALGMFSELDSDLDQLWEMPDEATTEKKSFLKQIALYVRTKLITFPIIPPLAFLLVLSIGITVFLSVLKAKLGFIGPFGALISFLQIVVPFILSTTLFALIYRLLPNRKLPWKMLVVGALSTAVFFTIGNALIAMYMKFLVHTNVFGGASSLVGLLVWIYYSAQVFLLGASFTFVLAKHHKVIPPGDSER